MDPIRRPQSPDLDARVYGSESARQALRDRRDRIRNHMNRDHLADMARMLRVFASVDAATVARTRPSLEWVHLTGMLIRLVDVVDGGGDAVGTTSSEHFVAFEPALRVMDEIRPRLKAMDAQAQAALGLGGRLHYVWPRGPEAVIMAGVLFYIACVTSLPWAVPETSFWAFLDWAWWPLGGASGWAWLVRVLRLPILGIHLTEAIMFHFKKLRPLGVLVGSPLWLAWELSCFVEGWGAFKRIDRLVKAEGIEKKTS